MDVVVSQLGELGERLRSHEVSSSSAADVSSVVRRVEGLEHRLSRQSAAATAFRSSLEVFRQTLASLKGSMGPEQRGTSLPEAVCESVKQLEDTQECLESRIAKLESRLADSDAAPAAPEAPPDLPAWLRPSLPLEPASMQVQTKLQEVSEAASVIRRTLPSPKVEEEPNYATNEAPWSALAHLTSALESFEAAIQEAEKCTSSGLLEPVTPL
mmetsp:Transcript_10250/g.23738  ORF Transcript_10250/g.23738 Transcript_10250/m.23738 type:complete len:213 (+) Transcript_10250:112-750(+)